MSARKPAHKSGKSSGKQPSVWLRQLKAKLPLLKRPAVWASGLLLLLPLIFLASYLRDPARFASSLSSDTASPEAAPPLSDPSSILEASTLDGQAAATAEQPSIFQTDLLSVLLADLSNSSDSKTLDKTQPQPAPANAPSSAQMPAASALPPTGLLEAAPANAVSPSPAVSSLQSALDRSLGITSPSSNPSGNPLTAQLQTQIPTETDTRARTNADVIRLYGEQGQGSQLEQPYRPATSPQAGSTGYVVPPALRTPSYAAPTQTLAPNSFPSQIPNQIPSQPNQFSTPPVGSYGSPARPGAYPQPSFDSPQLLVQPSPFSVPRTPPGRYIGNGQINTFSNP